MADEDIIDCNMAAVIEHNVLDPVSVLIRGQVIDTSVEMYADFLSVEFFDHRFVAAHGITAAHHRNTGCNIGELAGPVDSGIAAACNEHMPALEPGEAPYCVMKVRTLELVRALDSEASRSKNA